MDARASAVAGVSVISSVAAFSPETEDSVETGSFGCSFWSQPESVTAAIIPERKSKYFLDILGFLSDILKYIFNRNITFLAGNCK